MSTWQPYSFNRTSLESKQAQFARVKSGLAAITDPAKDSIIIYQLRDARWMNKEIMGVDKNPATNLL